MALTPPIARQLGLREPVGALITQVKPNSPAERAGLQPGDVIIGVNGQLLENPSGLSKALAGKTAGTKVQLNVVRDGREWRVMSEVADLSETRQPR
jgi:S1-C subfamily serine protease